MNSGGHPAMTPFTATCRTVTSRCAGGITPSDWSGGRSVNRRNSATACSVGGTTGSPSVQPESRKMRWISARVPERAGGTRSCASAVARERDPPINPAFTCGHSTLRVFTRSSSRVWLANAPGYSATHSSESPAEAAALLACFTNPGAAIITDGMPSTSAAMHEPVSFGVQSPHPPLPEMTASILNSLSLRWNSSFSRRTTPGRG